MRDSSSSSIIIGIRYYYYNPLTIRLRNIYIGNVWQMAWPWFLWTVKRQRAELTAHANDSSRVYLYPCLYIYIHLSNNRREYTIKLNKREISYLVRDTYLLYPTLSTLPSSIYLYLYLSPSLISP